jgi:hypothetical protein
MAILFLDFGSHEKIHCLHIYIQALSVGSYTALAAPALLELLPPGTTPAAIAAAAPAPGPSIQCFRGCQQCIPLLVIISKHINALP